MTVLEEKMNSDVMTILQIVRQSKLQQVSSPSTAADAASSADSPLNQTTESSQVVVDALLTQLV